MKAAYMSRIGILLLALTGASCGSVVREGTGTSFLIITALEAASGADSSTFSGSLFSDVQTIVDDVPTTFADVGRVQFQLGLKDPGAAGSPLSPTQNQAITIDRYRVRFVRSDGRNTQGVDIPYGFDGSFTTTVGSAVTQASFTLVRHIAKREAPLAALVVNGIVISTIAEITFYGRDQSGHEVSATGRISVDFGNFGDPN